MKIALYHNLPSGGALRHFYEVACALKDKGHQLDLFTPETAEQDFAPLHKLVDRHTQFPRKLFQPQSSWLNPFSYKKYLKEQLNLEKIAAQIFSQYSYDGLYLGQCQTWTEPPILSALPQSLPKILYCAEPKRSFYDEDSLKRIQSWPWWKKLYRLPTIEWMKSVMQRNIKSADLVLCNSKFSMERISKAYHGLKAQLSTIGTDCELFRPHSGEKEMQFLSVGALDPKKNHEMAIRVAALKPNQQDFKVIIVYDREYNQYSSTLKNLAQSLNVSLELKHRISLDKLIQLYASSYATIYCPREEPFGMVSIESQACGTPVFSIEEGGPRESIIHGETGFLLELEPKDYAEQIATCLKQPQYYQELCTQARQHILESFNQKTCLSSTADTIESFILNHRDDKSENTL